MRCPDAHDLAEPIADKVVLESEGRSTPLAFLLEMANVCPRCFVTPFAIETMKARGWWDKGQLGISYSEAPQWMGDAFGVITHEIEVASTLKRELTRTEKPARAGRT